MDLFTDCHFLFKVHFLCLGLHIAVLEPWTLENGVPSGEIGTVPTYSSLVRAQPSLSFPHVSITTLFLVASNDTG